MSEQKKSHWSCADCFCEWLGDDESACPLCECKKLREEQTELIDEHIKTEKALEAELARLRALNERYQESVNACAAETKEAREAARWLRHYSESFDVEMYATQKWPWLEDEDE